MKRGPRPSCLGLSPPYACIFGDDFIYVHGDIEYAQMFDFFFPNQSEITLGNSTLGFINTGT